MSLKQTLLTREERLSPTTPRRTGSEELEASPITAVNDNKPSLFARYNPNIASDLRSTNWKKFGKGYLLGFWIYCLFTTAGVLPVYLYLVGISSFEFRGLVDIGLGSPGCLPNDAFNARSSSYNIFDPSGFFQITHGFGDLTFTQAKVIDLIWDIVVGRCGQTILVYFSWKAFSTYFKLSMKTLPLTYDTFWAIFIERQPSLVSIYRVAQYFVTQQAPRSRSIMVFVPFSMLFVLAFPYLMSAMTGYRPKVAGFVTTSANSLIPFERFTLAAYVIHDGKRIGLTEDYVVPFMSGLPFSDIRRKVADTGYSSYGRSEAIQYVDDGYFPEAAWAICESMSKLQSGCARFWNVSDYVTQWGFYGLNNMTGKPFDNWTYWEWMGEGTQIKPALNISAFYIPPELFGQEWIDPRTKTKPFASISNVALNIEGTQEIYPLDYVQEHGSCQPLKSYQWGFSFLQVFLVAVLLLIWTCGTYLVWLKAHKTLERHDQLYEADREVPSEFKSALTFASSLHFEMAMADKEKPDTLTNKQLQRAIQENLKGGRILATTSESTATTSAPEPYSIVKETWNLCRKRWFIFPVLVLLTGYMTTMVLYPVFQPVAAGAMCVIPLQTAFVFAIAIGRTSRSRAFFVWMGIFAMSIVIVGVGLVFLGLGLRS